MDITTFITLMLIGIAAGMLGGFMGVGGGVIIVPALVYFMGMTQHQAQGTSLAAIMILPVGILAVMNYYKEGNANLVYGGVIALFFVAGSYFGSKLSLKIDPGMVKKAFGALLLILGVKLIFFK